LAVETFSPLFSHRTHGRSFLFFFFFFFCGGANERLTNLASPGPGHAQIIPPRVWAGGASLFCHMKIPPPPFFFFFLFFPAARFRNPSSQLLLLPSLDICLSGAGAFFTFFFFPGAKGFFFPHWGAGVNNEFQPVSQSSTGSVYLLLN